MGILIKKKIVDTNENIIGLSQFTKGYETMDLKLISKG